MALASRQKSVKSVKVFPLRSKRFLSCLDMSEPKVYEPEGVAMTVVDVGHGAGGLAFSLSLPHTHSHTHTLTHSHTHTLTHSHTDR